MAERLGRELVPDGLWEIVEPLIPSQRERPRGGGTRFVEDRAVCTAIVDVLRAGGAWRHLPAEFGVPPATAHRRFVAWTEAGVWRRLHRAVLARLGEQAAIDWSRAVVDVERSLAWLTGYRRLTLRYERCARLFTAFLTLAATLTCYKRLATGDKL